MTKTKHVKSVSLHFRTSEDVKKKAAKKAAEENRGITHAIVGTGPLKDLLKILIEEQKLENVHLLGFKQGSELRKLLAEALCVVVPSEWYENCPMSVVESFASGTPVIGYNIGGIPELIEIGVDGFIFEPGNARELASQVRWMQINAGEAQEMGMQGRQLVHEKFSWSMIARQLLDIYDQYNVI